MTDRECRAMLAGASVARLACAQHDQPYIVPIHINFDGQFLYGFAALGQKIEWMRQNPLVCLEIDELTTHAQWASVVIFGRYEELSDNPEYEGARRVAESLFQRRAMWWEPGSVRLAGHQSAARILFRIQIGRLTGRRAAPDEMNTSQILETASSARRSRSMIRLLHRMLGRQ